jgi:hypothetical protein
LAESSHHGSYIKIKILLRYILTINTVTHLIKAYNTV